MSKPIFAVDPGNKHSAYCVYFPDTHSLGDFGKVENAEMRNILKEHLQWDYYFAIEYIQSLGMIVGQSVFDTAMWVGRYVEIIKRKDVPVCLIYRKEEKIALCGTHQAKDANIRQAIIDRFPATGGGKCPQIGVKAMPGPLYGVSKDVWSALAVALTFHQKLRMTKAA